MRDRRGLCALVCATTLACATGSAPTQAEDPIETLALDAWRRAEVAGLSVYTNAPDAEALRVLRRMEQFVAFLGDFLGDFRLDGDVTAPRATDVFLFAQEEQLRLFTPDPEETGLGVAGFVTEPFPKTSLVSSVRGASPALTVFRHELVHVVHASDPDRRPPRWAAEGLAVYFSTVSLRSDVLTLGRPSDPWLRAARAFHKALPLARIFSWDGTEAIELDRFYADAWAFVHYGLQSEILGGPNRVGAFRAFADRVGRGEPWEPALEAAFGEPLPVVEAEFRRHRRRLLEAEVNTVVHLRVAIPTEDVLFEALPGSEIARRLAGLTSQVGDCALDTRRRLYDYLLELNAEDSEALLGRMRVAVLDHDLELAERLWSRVPVEPRGGLEALLAQAEFAQARWLAEPAETRDREHFVEARDAWARVLVVEPEHLPALLALGMLHVEADAEDPRVGLDALRRAIDLDPHRRSIRLDLARLLVRAGELDAARRELGPLAAAEENSETAREARRLLRQLR
jgi:hypothetical protein